MILLHRLNGDIGAEYYKEGQVMGNLEVFAMIIAICIHKDMIHHILKAGLRIQEFGLNMVTEITSSTEKVSGLTIKKHS